MSFVVQTQQLVADFMELTTLYNQRLKRLQEIVELERKKQVTVHFLKARRCGGEAGRDFPFFFVFLLLHVCLVLSFPHTQEVATRFQEESVEFIQWTKEQIDQISQYNFGSDFDSVTRYGQTTLPVQTETDERESRQKFESALSAFEEACQLGVKVVRV